MRVLRNTLLPLLFLAAWSCTEPTSVPLDTDDATALPDLSKLPVSNLVIGTSAAVCGIPTEVDLVLGPDIRTGSVQVTNDGADLYVRYQSEPGRYILATALFVGSSVSEIKTTGKGVPLINKFPFKSGHRWGTEEVVWKIALANLPEEELVIAAFAQIGFLPSWGEGEPITPGRDWAMYFTHRVASCASATIGPAGGTLATADENATLVIPEGALPEFVEITINPATIEEIQERVTQLGGLIAASNATRGFAQKAAKPWNGGLSASAADILLPTLAGIRPIPRTLWNFKPSGLRFLKAGTVTLRYRDQDLPPGTDERLLGVWLINGIIPYDRVGVVDADKNTVTAPIDHFSYGFIGFRETTEADLSILESGESANQVAIGEAVTYTATITNFGPGSVTDAVVLYQGFGDVVAGPLNDGCTEDAAPILATVVIRCAVDAVAVGAEVEAPSASFIPQAGGVFEVWIDPSSSEATDPDPSNNRFTDTFTTGAPTADLRIDEFTDSPDPVTAGGQVTYQIQAIAMGTTTAVSGAVLRLLFTGDAQFVSSNLTCLPIAGGIGCQLGTLQPGIVQNVNVVATLPTAGQTVTAEATIVVPAGITDPDLSNNVRTNETTVAQAGTTPIAVGQVIERPLPAGGESDVFQFTGLAGQIVRVSLSTLGATSSSTAELRVTGPTGDMVPAPPLTNAPRATELSSQNVILTLPVNGVYGIAVKSLGFGDYRLGLGTGVGRTDITFGSNGRGFIRNLETSNQSYLLGMGFVGSDIVTVGETYLSRFDSAGDLVPSFGTSGKVNVLTAINGRPTSLAVQPDGKIVVVAPSFTFPYPWIIARFNTDGTPDVTFGTNGVKQVSLGTRIESRPAGIGFYQDGGSLDIVVAGHSGVLLEQVGIVRLNSDGSLDATFGNGGIVVQTGGAAPQTMAVQPDGGVLVSNATQIRRYAASGALDVNFGAGGVTDYPAASSVYKIRLLNDGDIVAVGLNGLDGLVIRINPNGSLDGSFGVGGSDTYDFGLPDRFQDVIEDAQGRLVVAGHQRTGAGRYDQLVVRMSANGVLDAGFAVAGYLLENQLDDARAVLIDGQGRILVGGNGRTAFGLHISRHIPN